jgi:hypothetical protein
MLPRLNSRRLRLLRCGRSRGSALNWADLNQVQVGSEVVQPNTSRVHCRLLLLAREIEYPGHQEHLSEPDAWLQLTDH